VARDVVDQNLPAAHTREDRGIARKALSVDGQRYLISVGWSPKHPHATSEWFIFEIAATGTRSAQKNVLVMDYTAQPNNQCPFMIEMNTVQGTLKQVVGGRAASDFGRVEKWLFAQNL
jgi:hypothetical protein